MKEIITINLVIAMIACGCTADDAKLRIYVIDVSNKTWVNESLLIISPAGKTMLIDAGFSSEFVHGGNPYGQNVVRTFLKDLHISRLDYILLSHPHDDHIGGVKEILLDNHFEVGKILYSPVPYSEIIKAEPGENAGEYYVKLMKEILDVAEQKNIPVAKVTKGEEIDLGADARMRILSTGHPNKNVSDFINNNSIIAMLEYKKFRMLFTGDAGYAQEEVMMKEYPDLKCDILKAGHHAGEGANSEPWIRHISPSVAVASAPEWLFHDPRGKDGEKRFQQAKVPVLYTWKHGTFDIISNGVTTTINPHGDSKSILSLTK